ncbi:MAG: FkbM family methyltransferase [Cytophagaceae bacterium]
MKSVLKNLLQRGMGFDNYLFGFSLYKISTLRYDPSERDFYHFMKMLPKEGIVLDIGANIGLMTVSLAREIKDCEVYSFEPIPDNYNALKRITDFYGVKNVKLFPIALGNEDKILDMVMPVKDSVKMQGLCHVIDESIPKVSKGKKFSIPSKMLDNMDCIKNCCKPITGIKIDVEHFEWAVLEGGREIIKKYKPLIYCELADNMNRVKSLMLLEELGYKAKILVDGKLENFDKEKHKKVNFFFVPDGVSDDTAVAEDVTSIDV